MNRSAQRVCRCSTWVAIAILGVAPSAFADRAAQASKLESDTPAAAFAALVASGSTGQEATVEAALARLAAFPHELVRAVLESSAASVRSVEEARAGLLVLERLGVSADLQLAPILARPGSEDELEHAVLAIARRDARALDVLEGLVRAVSYDVRVVFVHAVEALGTLGSISWLARCADRMPDVRSEALARLGRLAQTVPSPAPDDALAIVHGVLAGVGSESLREAVIAAGRMEDGEAIPYLIPLLREEDPGLRADAAWALEKISGLRLRKRPEIWESWYAGELAWWREDSGSAFADLESPDSGTRTCALLDIASRRVSRDLLTQRVAPLLEDGDPAVAQLAAQALRSLNSKVACAALVQALERPEPAIGLEAWRALRAITRKDLPRDVETWRAACAR